MIKRTTILTDLISDVDTPEIGTFFIETSTGTQYRGTGAASPIKMFDEDNLQPIQGSIRLLSVAGSLTASDFIIECDGTFTLDLIATDGLYNGQIYFIKNIGVGVITVDPAVGEDIDGAATHTLSTLESICICVNNSLDGWYILSQKKTVSGGGGSANVGTTTIDFGTGNNEASIAVTGQAGILSTSYVKAWVMADDTTADHTASDHRYIEAVGTRFTCGTPSAGVGFTIYGRCIDKLQGTFKVRWQWV